MNQEVMNIFSPQTPAQVFDLSRRLRAEDVHHFLVHHCLRRELAGQSSPAIILISVPRPKRVAGPVMLGAGSDRPGNARPLSLCSLAGRRVVGGALLLGIVQVNIEAERTHFLDQHVERFRNTGFERVVTAHDRLIDLSLIHI